MFISFVILVGRHFVTKEEKHIVVHLIMQHLKYYKENNMI